ncbi:microtubule-associated proteins 1A/1B light chain 3C-like isoform X2 [Montipora capricornis]|uniref:microtubule-associated proteins 1A/1B light chain 3C-like isoform X2 n=1 Tax=Montipora capricornis TaxID=246305 RepID=UPI0035F1B48E
MGDNEGKSSKPFKQRKSFVSRRDEVAGIRAKFPSKIPVIVERYHKEKDLPLLDKTKFLVPQELTMSQFVTIISVPFSLAKEMV